MIGPAIGLLWFRIIEPIFLVLRYFHYRDVKKYLVELEDHIKDVHCYNTGTFKMQKLNGSVSVYADVYFIEDRSVLFVVYPRRKFFGSKYLIYLTDGASELVPEKFQWQLKAIYKLDNGQIEIVAQQSAKLVELKLTFEKMTERLQQKIITHLEAEEVPKSPQGFFER